MQLSLVYSKKYNKMPTKNLIPNNFLNYVNKNFTNNLQDQKSVLKYCFFFNRIVVLYNSKKQKIIYIFIIETKYIILKLNILNLNIQSKKQYRCNNLSIN